jgi:hypothetical protein
VEREDLFDRIGNRTAGRRETQRCLDSLDKQATKANIGSAVPASSAPFRTCTTFGNAAQAERRLFEIDAANIYRHNHYCIELININVIALRVAHNYAGTMST